MESWKGCKKLLCIRPDNMGDLIMSGPAIRALKESFGCEITMLTSPMGAAIVPFLEGVDACTVFPFSWVKAEESDAGERFNQVVEEVRRQRFDAAIVFTVYSQNPLPTVMIPYLAGVPLRAAYCRENPYALLTHWVPDGEPYRFIRHQVQRDLHLVKHVGAHTAGKELRLKVSNDCWPNVVQKLRNSGVDEQKPWVLFHAGVSEAKRQYPQPHWIETARRVSRSFGYQILLTGSEGDKRITGEIKQASGKNVFDVAGQFTINEFISLVQHASLVVSVNTATVHIAAAGKTPVVVLYAMTNPQHLPWMAKGKALFYSIEEERRSRNEVIRYVHDHLQQEDWPMIKPEDIVQSIKSILVDGDRSFIPLMPPLNAVEQMVQS